MPEDPIVIPVPGGEDPDQPKPAETGISDVVNHIMCTSAGGNWNDQTKICEKGGVPTAPYVEYCKQAGGTFDFEKGICIPAGTGTVKPKPDPKKQDNTALILGVGLVAAGILWWSQQK